MSSRGQSVGNGVWSPDGRRLAFLASGYGSVLLRMKTVGDDAAFEEIGQFEAHNAEVSDWSSDGHSILYQTLSATGMDLGILGAEKGTKPVAFLATTDDEFGAQFSPDGRWVAYESNASNREEIYVRSFPGPSDPIRVSAEGGSQARWGRDGRELFFIAADRRLMAAPIRETSGGRVLDVGPAVALFRTRLAAGSNIALGRPQYDVASDGRFLMNVIVDQSPVPPIAVVLNWDAALKK
jgi:Tol biopolymer transport system component